MSIFSYQVQLEIYTSLLSVSTLDDERIQAKRRTCVSQEEERALITDEGFISCIKVVGDH
jgi:hypothetical protein